MLGKGIGYGKTILFGEMFAVFGTPVIASALSMTADAEVVQTTRGCRWSPWKGSSRIWVSVRNTSALCSGAICRP